SVLCVVDTSARPRLPPFPPRRPSDLGRGDDQRALAVADRCDEVDGAAREFGAALRGATGLERDATLGIRSDQRLEVGAALALDRSEEHTSELQSRENLVCRLLLEKKK